MNECLSFELICKFFQLKISTFLILAFFIVTFLWRKEKKLNEYIF